MSSYPLFLSKYLKYSLFDSIVERAYWILLWNRLYRYGRPLTWDYQFYFHIFANSRLIAYPCKNLVKNIGFRPDAENTNSGASPLQNVNPLLPIKHPEFILRNRCLDKLAFRAAYLENSFFAFVKYSIFGSFVYFKEIALLFKTRFFR